MKLKSTSWLIFTIIACIATGVTHQYGIDIVATFTMIGAFGGLLGTLITYLEGE